MGSTQMMPEPGRESQQAGLPLARTGPKGNLPGAGRLRADRAGGTRRRDP